MPERKIPPKPWWFLGSDKDWEEYYTRSFIEPSLRIQAQERARRRGERYTPAEREWIKREQELKVLRGELSPAGRQARLREILPPWAFQPTPDVKPWEMPPAPAPEWAAQWKPSVSAAERAQESALRNFLMNKINAIATSLGIDPFMEFPDLPQKSVEDLQSVLNQLNVRFQYQPTTTLGRMRLTEAVVGGVIPHEQAFGAGTPWEQWQHEQADRLNWAAQKGFALEESTKQLIRRAQQLGVDTSFIENSNLAGVDANKWITQALAPQIQMAQQRMAAFESRQAAKEYPKWYERFLARYRAPSGEVVRGIAPEEEFLPWAMQQPEFKKARVEKQTAMLKKYPRLYPWFQEAKITFKEPKGFKGWIEETPLAKAYIGQRQEEMARPQKIRAPRWALGRV
jgi:hypothetical protein